MLLTLIQGETAAAGWIGPMVALSLLVIALSCMGVAVATLLMMRTMSEKFETLSQAMGRVEVSLHPILNHIQEITTQGRDLASNFRDEATAILRTSRGVRRRVRRGVNRIEERLQDLDALYEVVYDEVEGAALDVASVVHTVRSGGKWIDRLRRFFPVRRRRRR